MSSLIDPLEIYMTLNQPMPDASCIQFGFVVTHEHSNTEESCALELTVRSLCLRKLQLGLDKMVEQDQTQTFMSYQP